MHDFRKPQDRVSVVDNSQPREHLSPPHPQAKAKSNLKLYAVNFWLSLNIILYNCSTEDLPVPAMMFLNLFSEELL